MDKERNGETMKLGAFFHPTGNHVAAWLPLTHRSTPARISDTTLRSRTPPHYRVFQAQNAKDR